MNFKPLFDRVVVKNLEKQNKTASGIIIPETTSDEPIYGEVVAVGNGDNLDGNQSKMAVKVGDKVIYNKYGAINFKCDNKNYFIMRQSDILGIIKEKD